MLFGKPKLFTASKASSANKRVVPGCEELALAIIGFPAATAAAKSPPDMLPNANGKLLGPKTTTPPSRAAYIDLIFVCVSIVGDIQDRFRTALAASRNWFIVRGNSIPPRRVSFG